MPAERQLLSRIYNGTVGEYEKCPAHFMHG